MNAPDTLHPADKALSAVNLPPEFASALQVIHQQLAGKDIEWAITGSLGFALQGVAVEVHDIDIQTDASGAYAVEACLAEYTLEKVAFKESARIQSHFGSLQIGSVRVEIMGGLQKLLANGEWEAPVEISPHRQWVEYQHLRLPVLSLAYEYQAYLAMGRHGKARLLEQHLARTKEKA